MLNAERAMRLVLDTNTTVSGLLWSGAPRAIIDAAIAGDVELFSTRLLIDELADVLARLKLAARLTQISRTPTELLNQYLQLVIVIDAAPLQTAISRDPDDDLVLACAVAAAAEAVVSGDTDLLVLGSFQGIPILRAAEVAARLTPPSLP